MKPIAIVAIFLVFFPGAFERLDAYTIDFEGLTEGTTITNQYKSLGVTFSGGTVLQVGSLLNDWDYPPNSGEKVICIDPGQMILSFASPVTDFSAYVTYAATLTLTFYDYGDNVIGTEDSLYASNLGTIGDPGSSTNELFSFQSSSGISRLVFENDSSYALDDVTVSAVPEPVSWVLLVFGFSILSTTQSMQRGKRT